MTDLLGLSTTPGSPARMTASSTVKLARWSVILMCLLYILPGLVGRDPWKSEDATGFGVMWTMAEGRGFAGTLGPASDWLMPNIAGAVVFDNGPLMFWLGAACIELAGWLVDAGHAARLASVIAFFVGATSVWYATYLLGRRAAVQPLALAFGGQPDPRDYGRALADGALLILLGTIGLLRRAHESSSDMATMAMLGLVLYSAARSLDKPRHGAIWMGIALAGLALSDGPGAMFAMLLFWLVVLLAHAEFKLAISAFYTITVPLAAALTAIWPLLTYLLVPDAGSYFDARFLFWKRYFVGIDSLGLHNYLKTVPWYTWPAWPIAGWALWSWRRQLRTAHIILPAGYLLAILLLLMTNSDTSDGQLLMLLPGIVMLAAFGLPTLKRGTADAVDWFSLIVYSLLAVFLWFSWFARMTGIPSAWARTIGRQTPGFVAEFHIAIVVVALLATIGWFWIVRWRLAKHPKVLWRSVVLASGGLVLVWILINTLFLRPINYSRTYRDVASQIATRLPNNSASTCVQTDGLGLAQRASFAYFAGVHFTADTAGGWSPRPVPASSAPTLCPYLLRQDLARAPRPDTLPPGNWKMIWEGRRASDKDERFRLYRRAPGSRS